MDKEKLMNLVNTDFDKFQLEFKRIYKEEYVIKLEQQVKKQKEVIDKAIELIEMMKISECNKDMLITLLSGVSE